MKNGIPFAYRLYRDTWSALHFALVVIAFTAVAMWLLDGGRGLQIASDFWLTLSNMQQTITRVIRFPWEPADGS
ncbi:hypothetical protein [Cryobacterium aureum]|uniref:hypothetical protein n=1 Tax=Cryobacterium aureum TaxID=995037 RepID=UPI000CF501B4|nr:hypothetical protein [Cryobacterium aureum]